MLFRVCEVSQWFKDEDHDIKLFFSQRHFNFSSVSTILNENQMMT